MLPKQWRRASVDSQAPGQHCMGAVRQQRAACPWSAPCAATTMAPRASMFFRPRVAFSGRHHMLPRQWAPCASRGPHAPGQHCALLRQRALRASKGAHASGCANTTTAPRAGSRAGHRVPAEGSTPPVSTVCCHDSGEARQQGEHTPHAARTTASIASRGPHAQGRYRRPAPKQRQALAVPTTSGRHSALPQKRHSTLSGLHLPTHITFRAQGIWAR